MRDVCEAALAAWGPESQVMVLFEEMGELMQAIGKVRRVMPCDVEQEMPKKIEHVAEEIADVKIMLKQMEIMFDIEDSVEKWTEKKIRRLKHRIWDDMIRSSDE